IDINQLLVQHPQDALISPINLFNALVPAGFLDDPRQAGIDDRSWSTRLRDQKISIQFRHIFYVLSAKNAFGDSLKKSRIAAKRCQALSYVSKRNCVQRQKSSCEGHESHE